MLRDGPGAYTEGRGGTREKVKVEVKVEVEAEVTLIQ